MKTPSLHVVRQSALELTAEHAHPPCHRAQPGLSQALLCCQDSPQCGRSGKVHEPNPHPQPQGDGHLLFTSPPGMLVGRVVQGEAQ